MNRKQLVTAGILLIIVLFMIYWWHWRSSYTANELQPILGTSQRQMQLTQIKRDPNLSLLKGKLIILSDNQNGAISPQAVYQGMAYFLVQCFVDLNNSSVSTLVDPSQVAPITDVSLFAKLNGGKTQGLLTSQQMDQAHLALAYYNTNGWLLVKDINNLNYDGLKYDVNQNTVILMANDHSQGKNLYGQSEEYNK